MLEVVYILLFVFSRLWLAIASRIVAKALFGTNCLLSIWYPLLILCLSLGHLSVKLLSDSNEVPMRFQ